MSYAKSNSGIYNQTVSSDKDDSFAIEYNAGNSSNKGNSVINLKGLENEAYYYLYIKTDDENGKYTSNEAVTLARASVHDAEKWFMFFYGSSDFKWANFGNTEVDNTVAPDRLPQAGVNSILVVVTSVIAVGGIITYRKYKKYNF